MRHYDKTLPFLNRLLYSFPDGVAIWNQLVNDIPRMEIFVNNERITSHEKLHDYLYTTFSGNKLLTKYALCCCTQAVLVEAFSLSLSENTNCVIGECKVPKYMKVFITLYDDRIHYVIKKRVCSYKNDSLIIQKEFNMNIIFDIYKCITKMSHTQVETQLV